MTIFTPQERRVVLFLVVSLLAGSVVKLCRTRMIPDFAASARTIRTVPPSHTSTDTPGLDTLIDAIESVLAGKSIPLVKKVIDINTALDDELSLLPGIGPRLAQRIVDYRETHGKFKEIKDLVKVQGIGEKKLDAIRGIVTVKRDEETGEPIE